MNTIDRHRQRRTPAQNDALVLSLLRAVKKPVSAYTIARMAQDDGVKLVPNQVYRTLSRLLQQRQVRRIETLNAYLPWIKTADLCLVCAQCHAVELVALPSLASSLAEAVAGSGFQPATFVVELLGQCRRCQSARTQNQGTYRK